jgi:hypothetical protein
VITAPRLAAARAMTEAELQQHVRDLCADLGLYHYHPHYSRRSEPGWPDSVIVGSRVLFRELKSEHGTLAAAQRDLGERLRRAGQDWAVWRPRDLYSGAIGRQLAAIAAHPRLWEGSP